MHLQKSKKIIIYFFIFLIIGSLNNRNLNKLNLINLVEINATGLNEENTKQLIDKLDFIKDKNLLFLNRTKIIEIINYNPLIETYSVFKRYPSTLDININKTQFLAQIKKGNNFVLLGSNGKLIKSKDESENIPFIFGEFEIQNFFELKKLIDETNFNFQDIKNLFYFKSGRWDIETKNGLLIRLPRENTNKSFQLLIKFLNNNKNQIKELDLRQKNQIVINE
ncbi:cell division protein FtsQ/DivIB [Candidatus Pelagibacter sp.]|nr:cell division protein FtsQ/DivIB [Candidatus Pelagibacter sp.]